MSKVPGSVDDDKRSRSLGREKSLRVDDGGKRERSFDRRSRSQDPPKGSDNVAVRQGHGHGPGSCPRCSKPTRRKTSQLGLILAIVLYFVIGLYSLFFLLLKEESCDYCGWREGGAI